MAVFRVVAPCTLVGVHQLYMGACCLHRQWSNIALLTEAASISETSVNFYHTKRRYNPEDSHLHSRCLTSVTARTILTSTWLRRGTDRCYRSACFALQVYVRHLKWKILK
jgi:hypothetical protein